MRKLIGSLILVGGIFLAAYVGGWVCFIGGIVNLIEMVQKGAPVDALAVAINLGKVVFAAFIGQVIFLITTTLGTAIYEN